MKPMSLETSPTENAAVPSNEEVRKTTRLYLLVGLILFCATGATVAVATVPWLDVGGHGFDHWDALMGVSIASIKALLVAAVFMHLNHERRLIYAIMALAGVHAIGFFVGTYWHYADMTNDPDFYHDPASEDTDTGWAGTDRDYE
jgi:caa(3)-type oxidase subunit IV